MADCNPVSIPANPSNRVNHKMSPKTEAERREMESIPVREEIGSLMYLAGMTRGDISYAVNQVAAFVSNPGRDHWEAIKQILAYLAGTTHHGICNGGESINQTMPLIGYTDGDLAMDRLKRKSITGVCFKFHGGLISWGSKRQRATVLSTADSEFYAASEGSREAIWFKALLAELGIDVGVVPIFCDSKCARSIIEDSENRQRVKHIDIKYFFVREQQKLGTLMMMKISGDLQIADIFTKPLPKKRFEMLRRMMGIYEINE